MASGQRVPRLMGPWGIVDMTARVFVPHARTSRDSEWQRIGVQLCVAFREWNHWLMLYDGNMSASSFFKAYRDPTSENLEIASRHLAYAMFAEDFLHAELMKLVPFVRVGAK